LLGSLPAKVGNIERVLQKYGHLRSEAVFVGDATSGVHGTAETGLSFVNLRSEAAMEADTVWLEIRSLSDHRSDV
jgi:hypothetical protein